MVGPVVVLSQTIKHGLWESTRVRSAANAASGLFQTYRKTSNSDAFLCRRLVNLRAKRQSAIFSQTDMRCKWMLNENEAISHSFPVSLWRAISRWLPGGLECGFIFLKRSQIHFGFVSAAHATQFPQPTTSRQEWPSPARWPSSVEATTWRVDMSRIGQILLFFQKELDFLRRKLSCRAR